MVSSYSDFRALDPSKYLDNVSPGRTATITIAAADSSLQSRAQADFPCDGIDDYEEWQDAFDIIAQRGYGKIKALEGSYHLGDTGVDLHSVDNSIGNFTLDFREATIFYSGVGSAITIRETGVNKLWNGVKILGGLIEAEGGAIASATAIGLTIEQLYSSKIDVRVTAFKKGIAIKDDAGNAWCSYNEISLYANECKDGLYLVGIGGHHHTSYLIPKLLWHQSVTTDVGGSAIRCEATGSVTKLELLEFVSWTRGATPHVIHLAGAQGVRLGHLTFEYWDADFVGIKIENTAESYPVHVDSINAMNGAGSDLAGYVFDGGSSCDLILKAFRVFQTGPTYDGGWVKPNGTKQILCLTQPRNNRIENGDFDDNVAGWDVTGTADPATWEAPGRNSSHCMGLTVPVANAWRSRYNNKYVPCVEGQRVFLGYWAKAEVAGHALPSLAFYDENKANVVGVSGAKAVLDTVYWTYVWGEAVVPAGKRYVRGVVEVRIPNVTDKVYIDDVVLSVPTVEFESFLADGSQSLHNLLLNGDFEVGDPPTAWRPTAGITLSREAAIIKVGSYSLKCVTTDTSKYARQDVLVFLTYAGRLVTLGCWVWCAVANTARLELYDGVGVTASLYHSGGSSWEWLTLTRLITAVPTELRVMLVQSLIGTAYFDGAILVEGESCPAFSPRPTTFQTQCIKGPSLDLSGGATDIEVYHALIPGVLLGYSILYTEASDGNAGVDIRVGRYQDGVALDDDYFDLSTSELNKSKGYSKFFDRSLLTQTIIAAGDTITVGTAGGKTGTGEVMLFLYIGE